MKHNLKNRPHLHWEKTLSELGYETVSDVEKWFEGFEKELRQQLAYGEKSELAWRGARKHRVDEELAMEWQGANHKIKEVLGDSQ